MWYRICRTSPVNGPIVLYFDLPKPLYSQWHLLIRVNDLYWFHKLWKSLCKTHRRLYSREFPHQRGILGPVHSGHIMDPPERAVHFTSFHSLIRSNYSNCLAYFMTHSVFLAHPSTGVVLCYGDRTTSRWKASLLNLFTAILQRPITWSLIHNYFWDSISETLDPIVGWAYRYVPRRYPKNESHFSS